MATVSVLSTCAGGNHVRLRVTLAGDQQVTRTIDINEALAAIDGISREDFILKQIYALCRNNPGDTPAQRRNRIEAYTFLE